ncbi:M14 family zinc carboxypeptidase [Marinirhabdus gelatinilytica]|uniref:carboxypeptidase T n=1 Tax=Marinirhabdus gelatinilytica TaxID=1703343 RepID=A0A370QA51_9FLAO|nr:M14 family zinc carboxypeptidase [Marinirhabdus gelatinilytica]RDK85248.1 putative secreted protein (Por secretion system target) [Marinirhabdus gelatinilytica]
MKIITFILCTVLFSVAGVAQEVYSEVKVTLPSSQAIQTLSEKGYSIDHYRGNWEDGIHFFVTQQELQSLQTEGYPVDITIPNYHDYYTNLQQADRAAHPNPTKSEGVANGFDLGSMGGFYTFDEVVAKLDEMKTDYPNLITAKQSIGTTIEGRDIWMVKISDNPDIDEPEPAAHFDALHHAREPLSMATTINFMFWLLENYETDASVKFLVDNREIYFVPVVNPDGYVYNETIEPNGGGLWRKNRRPDIGGCVGVDLNRNYGFGYATDDNCSSPDPCSGIYRGTGPFSEPESIAIRDLLATTGANTAFSTHSTAGTYLMPYGFDTSPPAFDIYSEWASAFLDENDYSYGVTFQMLGYTSCGTTRDYMHSEDIYGWTPEIDGSGFWPPESTIFDLVAENVRPFLFQTYIAGAYLDVQSYQINGPVLPGNDFTLTVEVKNIGVGAMANNVSVIAQADNVDVISPTASTFGNIEARERKDNAAVPFQFQIEPQFQGGVFNITITTVQDGIPNETITIPIFIGNTDILFEDNAENGASQWTPSGNGIPWGVNTDDSFSGTQCFGDSNNGNSLNDTQNYFQLNQTFNFSGLEGPLVQFAYKHSLIGNDVASFQVSTNSGTDWETLRNYQLNEDWTVETVDLSDFAENNTVQFRFSMGTDGFRPGDGFYFDDFKVVNYTEGILNTSNFSKEETISVYPNPFAETIIVQHRPLQKFETIQLFDITGKELTMGIEETTTHVTLKGLSHLQSGTYFLVLKEVGGDSTFVKRVVKK